MRIPVLISICLLAVLVICLCLRTHKDSMMPLMRAAYNDDIARVNALITAKADVNAKDNDGWTAFMWAAGKGHVDCVTALIAGKAEVNVKPNNGNTALTLAQQRHHLEIVAMLKAAGAKE